MKKISYLVIFFTAFLALQPSIRAETQDFLDVNTLFTSGEHKGDITLSGREVLVLENREFKQFGNIYLKDSSKLIIRNASLQLTRQRADWHCGIYPENYSSLEIDSSILRPGNETGFIIEARGMSHVSMNNSPTKIHLFTVINNARAEIENSEVLSDIGGLIGAQERGVIKVKNSKIGAVLIGVLPGTTLVAEGLGTGFYKEWSVQKNLSVSNTALDIILENTEIIPDDLEPGGFERSWTFLIHSGANVSIKNSNLRRIVIVLDNENAEFNNFYLGRPSDFEYRNIKLENVTVSSQWGLFIRGSSDVAVRDSEGLFTVIFDDSKVTLINTYINEFGPKNFHGEIFFENSTWGNPPVIIQYNDFVMKGNVKIDPRLIPGTAWEDSNVTKFYNVLGEKETELTLEKYGEIVWSGKTDENGEAEFSIKFNDTTFKDKWVLKDNSGNSIEVGFFSEIPIKLESAEFKELQLVIAAAIIIFIILVFLVRRRI